MASLPPNPKGLSLLISYLYNPRQKYFVNSNVFDKHYKPEFIKHVFPKFYSPVIPLFELGVKISFKSLFIISSNLVPLVWESSDISNSFVSSYILGVVRG